MRAASGRKVEFTPKCNIEGGEKELTDFFLLVTQELMQSFEIVALLLLTDSGGYVKFTLKHIIVGDVGVGRGGGGNIFF